MRKLISSGGEEVTIPEDPERIISFSPSVTEILYQLGMADKIVGVSAFCARPEATRSKRRVGSYGSARRELLEELRPDLVLTISGFQRKFSDSVAERFPVYMFELPSTVAGILDLIIRVGIVVNRIDEARELSRELLTKVPVQTSARRLRGYLEIDLGGSVSFGSMSYITDALYLMGVNSIYRDSNSEWLMPDDDFILRNDPQIIFYEHKMYTKLSDADLQKIVIKRKWDGTSAGKANAIFKTPGTLDYFAHHGPSFITEVMPWAMKQIESTVLG